MKTLNYQNPQKTGKKRPIKQRVIETSHSSHWLILTVLSNFLLLSFVLPYDPNMNSYSYNACGNGCLNCEVTPGGQTGCLQCGPGYRRSNANCIPCQIDGCSECPKNTALCYRCHSGFYNATLTGSPELSLISRCDRCPINCEVCVNSRECQICKRGYSYEQISKNEFVCVHKKGNVFALVLIISVVLTTFGIYFLLRRKEYSIRNDVRNGKKKLEKRKAKKYREDLKKKERTAIVKELNLEKEITEERVGSQKRIAGVVLEEKERRDSGRTEVIANDILMSEKRT